MRLYAKDTGVLRDFFLTGKKLRTTGYQDASEVPAQVHQFSQSFLMIANGFCVLVKSVKENDGSRASLLTGQYARRHGVTHLDIPLGSPEVVRELEDHTIATVLQNAGYHTSYVGKYHLNRNPSPAPPGWDRWWVFHRAHYGGRLGETYRIVSRDGSVTVLDDHSTDAQYSTDLSGAVVRAFVEDAIRNEQPFFMVWAPYAPHVETPAFVPIP